MDEVLKFNQLFLEMLLVQFYEQDGITPKSNLRLSKLMDDLVSIYLMLERSRF
jgi:hypothetical protein